MKLKTLDEASVIEAASRWLAFSEITVADTRYHVLTAEPTWDPIADTGWITAHLAPFIPGEPVTLRLLPDGTIAPEPIARLTLVVESPDGTTAVPENAVDTSLVQPTSTPVEPVLSTPAHPDAAPRWTGKRRLL